MSSTIPGDGPNKDPSNRPVGSGGEQKGEQGEGKSGGHEGGGNEGHGREGADSPKTSSKGINPVQHSE